MKKIAVLGLVIILILSAGACSARNKKPEQLKPGQNNVQEQGYNQPIATQYNDGEYTAQGDKWQFGYENSTVKIQNGKIASITLRRFDTNGKEVNYDEWQGQKVNNQVHPNLKKFRVDMANAMLEKQSTQVDTISGASLSTQNWKVATQRALEKAVKK